MSKTVDNTNPHEGDTIVYTVSVTNNGPIDATGVALSDVLPTGLTYVGYDTGASGTSYDSASGLWTLGALANGQTATLNLTATVDAGTGGSTLTNTASVGGLDQVDPNAGNDSASVDLSVAAVSGGGEPLGLIHYWKLDEASGSSYSNAVDSGPSAACSACPTPATGRIGGAQEFDGMAHEVDVADDNSFDWSNSGRFSLEAWIKRDSPCSITGETVVGRKDAVSQLEWSLGCEGSNARFRLIDTSGAGAGEDLVGTTDIADGQWHHVVAVRDAISGKNLLYVDGVEEASISLSYTGHFVDDSSLNIGWLQGGSDQHFAGIIDEIALHDRVLPDSEIRRHYADGVVGLQRGYRGCGAPVRIMPLGDSITRRQGYRPGLYFDLLDAGMDVDMVGSKTDSCPPAPDCAHDPNHEGHSGYTPTDIAVNVATWLGSNPADVVTLHIGTNVDPSFPYPDVTQVEAILNAIDGYDPDIPVVLARIINKARGSEDPQLSPYNESLEALAQDRIALGDRIIVVDQEPGLDYSESTTDFPLDDDLHPT
ncbi:MAG: hypothetical protein PVI91_17655, partial [Gammaproteobacteria bacterium]